MTTKYPVCRVKHEAWKATNRKVLAFIDVQGTFVGYNLGFDTRDKVLTFVRALRDSFDQGTIYGGGYDAKGEFFIVGRPITRQHYGLTRPTGRVKLVIEPCEGTEEEAA